MSEEVIVIKKLVAVLLCMSILLLAAGCGGSVDAENLPMLSVYKGSNSISIGDTREAIEKFMDYRADITEFEEENVERYIYTKDEGVSVDYIDDQVIAIRIREDSDWKMQNGLKVGMSLSEAQDLFSDYVVLVNDDSGSLMIGLDNDWNPIEYYEEVPYFIYVRPNDSGDTVKSVQIQDNLAF